jgi:hypothetical protein
MYLFYVDESGDVGLNGSQNRFFVLSGIVIHELCWHDTLNSIIQFRKDLRIRYGLKLREEIHTGELLRKPGDLIRIAKSLRLRLLRDVLDFQSQLPGISIINVVVDKNGKPIGFDAFDLAWKCLIQRFHNTIDHRNFPGPRNSQDFGLLVVDRTDEVKLRTMTRRMRRYNPIPNQRGGGYRQVPLTTIVEDAVHRDSKHSYFIQLADVNAYFLLQKTAPCGYVRKKGARNYFDRLDPVLCKVANNKDPQGVVRL